jgi:hypothetical protein
MQVDYTVMSVFLQVMLMYSSCQENPEPPPFRLFFKNGKTYESFYRSGKNNIMTKEARTMFFKSLFPGIKIPSLTGFVKKGSSPAFADFIFMLSS